MTAAIRPSRSISTRPSIVSDEPLLLLVNRDAGTRENEVVAASRDDLDRRYRAPEICDHPHVLDLGIATAAGSACRSPAADRRCK